MYPFAPIAKATAPILTGTVRIGAVAFAIGAKGYIGTGDSSGYAVGLLNNFWEYLAALYVPVAYFKVSNTNVCVGNVVSFMDSTTNDPTSWNWSFPGGTPNTDTIQSPTVTYNVAGNYDVTLITSNAAGSDTVTMSNYIT